MVPGLRLKDLGRVSRPRNLLLFSLMARMDLVAEVGSGIKRIRDAISSYGLQPPIIETDGDWFSITFRRKGMDEAIEQVQKDLTPIEMDSIEAEKKKKTTCWNSSGILLVFGLLRSPKPLIFLFEHCNEGLRNLLNRTELNSGAV